MEQLNNRIPYAAQPAHLLQDSICMTANGQITHFHIQSMAQTAYQGHVFSLRLRTLNVHDFDSYIEICLVPVIVHYEGSATLTSWKAIAYAVKIKCGVFFVT